MAKTRLGIDVSVHQGEIDWAKVKAAGVRFAMLRCAYGWDNPAQVDKRFAENVTGCEAVGLPYGLYHYSYAKTPEETRKEALFFLRTMKEAGAKPEYPLAFDLEEAAVVGGADGKGVSHKGLAVAEQMELIETFLGEIEQAGYYGMLYMSASPMERLRRAYPERMGKYDCWVAHVGAKSPAFGGGYGIWQHSWKGKIDGIAGDVDLNWGYKDYPAIVRAAGLNGFAAMEKPAEPGLPGPEKPETEEPESEKPFCVYELAGRFETAEKARVYAAGRGSETIIVVSGG